MKMKTTLKIFTDASNDKKALGVLDRIKKQIEFGSHSESCEPYHKGGFVCSLEVNISGAAWEEMPYKLLILCQSIGRAWQITGSIEDEFDAWSNESSISGVGSIHVQCMRQA